MPRPISSRITSERWRRLVQDRRRLDHLDHEGRAAARQIVGGADAAEQAIDDADMGGPRRHEGADLGQHGDQRVLAQEGRFAGHVGAGRAARAAALSPRSQSLATKAPALLGDAAPPRPRDGGPPRSRRRRWRRPPGGSSRPRRRARPGRRRHRAAPAPRPPRRSPRPPPSPRHQLVEAARARAPAPCRRRWRCVCSSSPSSTVVKRVALAIVWRWMKPAVRRQLLRMRRRRLDVVAEHVVVPDLERGDAGLAAIARLQLAAPGAGSRRAAPRSSSSSRR